MHVDNICKKLLHEPFSRETPVCALDTLNPAPTRHTFAQFWRNWGNRYVFNDYNRHSSVTTMSMPSICGIQAPKSYALNQRESNAEAPDTCSTIKIAIVASQK